MDKKSYILQLLKYFVMAVIVGIIVGAIDALFGRVEPYIINTYFHSCQLPD